MSELVYLLSSLPSLDVSIFNSIHDYDSTSFGNICSVEDFIFLCQYTLSPTDAQNMIVAMRNPEESTSSFVLSVVEYMSSVADVLAQKRHEQRRSGSYVHAMVNDRIPVSADASFIAARVTNAKNPLIREIEILKSLWAYLDDCDAQYQYTFENVFVYGYKLKLFHKAISFQRDAGDTTWKQLVEMLAKKAGFFSNAIAIGGKIDTRDGTHVAKN